MASLSIVRNLIVRLISGEIKRHLCCRGRKMSTVKPVVIVLGATGTGKSRLAVEIARRFGGEIIGADSMQVYNGLDVITNKISAEQLRNGPKHHLLSHVDPLVETYTVVDFRNSALPIINGILEDGNLPVIVGGTNYYIESLLWKVLVSKNVKRVLDDVASTGSALDKLIACLPESDLRKLSNKELHDLLKQLDPEMAKLIHPNDRRKTLRSVQVYEQHGCPHSRILEEQQGLEGGSDLGGPLRYLNACILWLQCERTVLEKRLDDRVDDMLTRGLLVELDNFHARYNEKRLQDGSAPDYTKGIFQSIGFKEFHPYLMLPRLSRETPEGERILREGVARLKLVTRRYAKVQLKWIRNRFLQCPDRQLPPIFALDATSLETWDKDTMTPAIEIVTSLLKGLEPSTKPLGIASLGKDAKIDRRETVECDVCQVVVKGQDQWKAHLKSKKHRSLKRQPKLADLAATEAVDVGVLDAT